MPGDHDVLMPDKLRSRIAVSEAAISCRLESLPYGDRFPVNVLVRGYRASMYICPPSFICEAGKVRGFS